MKSIIPVFLAVLIPLGAIAQENRASRVPAASKLSSAARATIREAPPTRPQMPGLSKNVTVSLVGNLQGIVPVDLELTGCGPKFLTDYSLPVGEDGKLPPTIITIEVLLTEIEGGFHLDYSMGARVAEYSEVQRAPAGAAKTISFRNLLLKGAARVKLGEALALSKIGGKTLQVTVAEAR